MTTVRQQSFGSYADVAAFAGRTVIRLSVIPRRRAEPPRAPAQQLGTTGQVDSDTPQGHKHSPPVNTAQQQQRAAVQAAMQQLSLGVYSQLAVAHARMREEHQDVQQTVDPDRLRQLAADSVTVARCYFEGIGVIQRKDEGSNNTPQ